jgi:hypothetical protein
MNDNVDINDSIDNNNICALALYFRMIMGVKIKQHLVQEYFFQINILLQNTIGE